MHTILHTYMSVHMHIFATLRYRSGYHVRSGVTCNFHTFFVTCVVRFSGILFYKMPINKHVQCSVHLASHLFVPAVNLYWAYKLSVPWIAACLNTPSYSFFIFSQEYLLTSSCEKQINKRVWKIRWGIAS